MPIKEYHYEKILEELGLSKEEVCVVFSTTNQNHSFCIVDIGYWQSMPVFQEDDGWMIISSTVMCVRIGTPKELGQG